MTAGAAVRLHRKLEPALPPLRAACARLWRDDAGLADRYRRYLVAMHQVVRASVPLLERAATRCERATGPGGHGRRALAAALRRHADAERGHDDWLVEDAEVLGMPAEALLSPLPPPEVARLVGPAGYWAEHHHPVALLGYVTVLERHAPAPWLAADLAARSGLPAAAFRTLHEHAVLDGDHCDGVDRALDAFPDDRHEAAVSLTALHTALAATDLFHHLAGPCGRPAVREDTP